MLVATALIHFAFATVAHATDLSAYERSDTPLLDYAQSLPPYLPSQQLEIRTQLKSQQAELDRYPPPPREDCARTLGATRFSRAYEELGASLSALNEYEGAIAAYENALACTPRALHIHAELATEFLHAGRLAESRAAAERGRGKTRAGRTLDSVMMQLDFIDERWAEVVSRLRAMSVAEEDPERSEYWMCFLWLAQRRAGIKSPELPTLKEWDGWPANILETLKGSSTESALLSAIDEAESDSRRHELLTEAFYYIGQDRLASGDAENARRYFAMAVNMKVPYFIEYHLARAEIVKMRASAKAISVAEGATPSACRTPLSSPSAADH